ncbi:hypothetical protein NLU13_7384 [Sarocladium strictum]|uniref:Uncharacterized protein n=1 Tax=Sarocladium strictum TaxID=5046 RepID=A0AA39L5P2_SARSR|nr:hypothetical protein NLU13_7384 [Sarocladium strictum]
MADEKSSDVSTLPSGEPLRPPPTAARSLIASVPAKADDFLCHLNRVVQTRSGHDLTLLWLSYSSNFAADLLNLLAQPPTAAKNNAILRTILSVTELVIRPGSLPAALALQFAARLKAFTGTLAEIRIFARLWGLLGLYFGAKAAAEKRRAAAAAGASPDARFDTVISHAQLVSLVTYQALENISYLSSRKVIPLSPYLTGRLGKWSVRSWMVYIGLELGKLLVERAKRVPNRAYDAESVKKEKEWRANWRKEFLRTLAWAPLTVNWSCEQPFLPSLAVSALAFYPSMGMMRDLWRAKAQA